MIHLYAFVDGLRTLPSVRGAADEPLATRSFGGVTAVVGECASALPETVESALAHGRVVESLAEHAAAVLPARLSRPFEDGAALADAALPRADALREQLGRVRGCVELGVRIAAAPTQGAPATTERTDGASYLRARAAAAATRAALAADVQAALARHALDRRVEEGCDGQTLFRASYLVPRPAVTAFAAQVDRLGARHPQLAIVCTGPWAPYSFTEELT